MYSINNNVIMYKYYFANQRYESQNNLNPFRRMYFSITYKLCTNKITVNKITWLYTVLLQVLAKK